MTPSAHPERLLAINTRVSSFLKMWGGMDYRAASGPEFRKVSESSRRTASTKTWLPLPLVCCLALGARGAWSHGIDVPQTPRATTTDPAGEFTELVGRPGSLTAEQKAKARELFSTGFVLWQSGDNAAAAIGFRRGLDIDPANPQANYYLGDCLRRTNHRKEAADYFNRASLLGNGSAESLKAEAALQALSNPVSIADMSADELKDVVVGSWDLRIVCSWGTGRYKLVISNMSGDAIAASKIRWDSGEGKGRVHNGQISLSYKRLQFAGRLVDVSKIEGTVNEDLGACQWIALK